MFKPTYEGRQGRAFSAAERLSWIGRYINASLATAVEEVSIFKLLSSLLSRESNVHIAIEDLRVNEGITLRTENNYALKSMTHLFAGADVAQSYDLQMRRG